jgi:hypothetical protein
MPTLVPQASRVSCRSTIGTANLWVIMRVIFGIFFFTPRDFAKFIKGLFIISTAACIFLSPIDIRAQAMKDLGTTVFHGAISNKLPTLDSGVIGYQKTGEQYRVYTFPETGEPIPYRLYVPESWQPGQRLPVLVTLRAGPHFDNNHRSPNALVAEARRHGYIVLSPLGYRGLAQPYYGSGYPIIRPTGPSEPAAGWTVTENLRAEHDVLNTLSLVMGEYGADANRLYIHGQNPSGSGALHFLSSYPGLFKAAVISSAPIDVTSYPVDQLVENGTSLFILHGTNDNSNEIQASRTMARSFSDQGVVVEYFEVEGGEHLNSYQLAAPQIFDFLEAHR